MERLKFRPDVKQIVAERLTLFRKFLGEETLRHELAPGTMVATILRLYREMRHLRQWMIVASQDLDSLAKTVLGLATMTIVHRLKSVASQKLLAKHNLMFEDKELQLLEQGEAFVVANEASDSTYRTRPQKIRIRGTSAMPTGTTEKAVPDPEKR